MLNPNSTTQYFEALKLHNYIDAQTRFVSLSGDFVFFGIGMWTNYRIVVEFSASGAIIPNPLTIRMGFLFNRVAWDQDGVSGLASVVEPEVKSAAWIVPYLFMLSVYLSLSLVIMDVLLKGTGGVTRSLALELLIAIVTYTGLFWYFTVSRWTPRLSQSEFMDFYYMAQAYAAHRKWMGCVLVLNSFKVLGFLKELWPHVSIVTDMLMRASSDLFTFLIIFMTLMFGFASTFCIVFNNVPDFWTLGSSFLSLFRMMLGSLSSALVVADDAFFGPILYTVFILVCLYTLMTAVFAILNDAFREARNSRKQAYKLAQASVFTRLVALLSQIRRPRGDNFDNFDNKSSQSSEPNWPSWARHARPASRTDHCL